MSALASRRSAPAVIGAAALAVAAVGVAAAASPPASRTVSVAARPAPSPTPTTEEEPVPWDDPAPREPVAFTIPSSPGVDPHPSGGSLRIGVALSGSFDPHLAFTADDELVAQALFAPLVQYDATHRRTLDGAAASSVTPDATCTTWTVRLKPGTFTDGSPVDAAAYERGWTTAAQFGGVFEVEGSQDLQNGDAKTLSGFRVVDASTFRVTLTGPSCAFDQSLTQSRFAPAVVGAVPGLTSSGSGRTTRGFGVGDGPFTVSAGGESLVRNPTYAYGTPPHLDEVQLVPLRDGDGQSLSSYNAFADGRLDVSTVPANRLGAARKVYGPKGAFLAQVTGGATYLAPVLDSGATMPAKARAALSFAIDRDAVIAGAFDGFADKADGLVPPSMPGFAVTCGSCTAADPLLARQLAQASGLEPGTHLTLYYYADGTNDKAVGLIRDQLHTVLGLDVDLSVDGDTLDPGTVVFASTGEYFGPGTTQQLLTDALYAYKNPDVDALIAKGDDASLVTAQFQAVGTDLAVIPLWWSTGYRVFDASRFGGVQLGADGQLDLRAVWAR